MPDNDNAVEVKFLGCCNCMIYTCWICCNNFDYWCWSVRIACRGICHRP